MQPEYHRIEELAHQIWEEQGRPDGRHEDHWSEAERRLSSGADTSRTDAPDPAEAHDTPGRPTSSGSRQQTQKDQETQTGSPELDARNGAASKSSR